ncbi:MAG: hypothetical protein IT536_00970 [Hyphomicrobiales bacterium]|nr:hypothetical protein [Hyphomicrobiales bacterium]
MMTLAQIVAQLLGRASAEPPRPLSPAEHAALSRRWREIVEGDERTSDGLAGGGTGPDAFALARYLEGSMEAAERDAFEAQLVASPRRRDELLAAVAWADAVEATRMLPPAELTARAIALGTPVAATSSRTGGPIGWIERLLPRPRLAVATAALATVAIVAVGLDIALHLRAPYRQSIQLRSTPSSDLARSGEMRPEPSAREGALEQPLAPSTLAPSTPRADDRIVLTAETINALVAYHDQPTPARRQEVLAALARAGVTGFSGDRVRAIALQPKLHEQLTQRGGSLPTQIVVRLSLVGELTITIAD